MFYVLMLLLLLPIFVKWSCFWIWVQLIKLKSTLDHLLLCPAAEGPWQLNVAFGDITDVQYLVSYWLECTSKKKVQDSHQLLCTQDTTAILRERFWFFSRIVKVVYIFKGFTTNDVQKLPDLRNLATLTAGGWQMFTLHVCVFQ